MAITCRHLGRRPIFPEPKRCLLGLHSRVHRLEIRLAHQSRFMRPYLSLGDMRRYMARAPRFHRRTTRTFGAKCRTASLLPYHSNTLIFIHVYSNSSNGRVDILLSCPTTRLSPSSRYPLE